MVIRRRLQLSGSRIVFVTTTVFEWKPILTQNNVIPIILKALNNIYTLNQASIISYVIMPSHIHLLMGFRAIINLSQCVQGFKSITSRIAKKLALSELSANDHRLWKPRFDDLIISSGKQFKVKMEYIHNNPVKAGLVDKAKDWPYSSAVDWLTTDQGMVTVDRGFSWLES